MTKYFLRNSTGRISGKPVDFEDAIILAGYGRFQRRLLLTSGFCLMAVFMELFNIGYVLPVAYCDLQLTATRKAILNAIVYLGVMLSSHTWGFLADTKGRKYVLIFSLLLNCLCTIISSFSFSFWMLAGSKFLNGIFICAPGAVTYAYLGEFHSRVTRTKAIVSASSFTSLALVALPGLAWAVIPQPWSYQLSWYRYGSWRMFQMLTVLPGLVAAALLLFLLPESPRFLLSRGRHRQAVAVLQHVFTVNSGCRADQYPVTVLIPDRTRIYNSMGTNSKLRITSYMWSHTKPLFAAPYRSYMMLLCLLQFGLFSCVNSILLWMPDLLSQMAEFSSHDSALQHTICEGIQQNLVTFNTTSFVPEEILCNATIEDDLYRNMLIIGGVTTLGYLLISRVINLLGRKRLLFASSLTSGCAGVALYFVLESHQALMLTCIIAALASVCISMVISTTVEVFPTVLRAMAVCISVMMGCLGTMLALLSFGFIVENYCNYVFFVLGGIFTVCSCLSLLLPAHSTSLPATLMS